MFDHITKKYQKPGSDAKPGDGTAQNKGLYPVVFHLANSANDDGTQRDAHKMRLFNMEVVQHIQHIPGNVLEVVFVGKVVLEHFL